MSLYLDGKPDLLALAGGRELDYMPWHFVKIRADHGVAPGAARNWIWKNLEGRFHIKFSYESQPTPITSSAFHPSSYASRFPVTMIGFEEPMEASSFVISQALLKSELDIF